VQPIKKTGLGEPTIWWVMFAKQTDTWWTNLIPGTYKHVRAAGYHPGSDSIVFVDVGMQRTMISVGTGHGAWDALADWMSDMEVVTYRPQHDRRTVIPMRFGYWCVPAIKHLLGIRSGALRPDALLRDLLRNGATRFAPPESLPNDQAATATE
jgi:hypothetical protein